MGPLRKIERVGKTKRDEIAGKTSVILDAFVKKLFHLAWDVDRVPIVFIRKFRSRLTVYKEIDPQRAARGP
jgi:hypothetical protein